MPTRIILIFILCNISFLSCNNESAVPYYDIAFKKFPKLQSLRFQDFIHLNKTIIPQAIFLNDTSLIAVNKEKLVRDYLFYEFSLKSKLLIGKYFPWGAKTGRTIAPMSCGLYKKNILWCHDLALNKIILGSLKNKNSFDSITFLKEYKVPEFAYSTQLMDSNKIIKSGIFHIPELLQISALQTNASLSVIGDFKPPNHRLTFNTWKAAYEAFLFLRPTEDKVVLACRYSDRIKIYNLHTKRSKVIFGPEQFEPYFDQNPNADFPIIRNKKTVFAYLGGCVTNGFIYLLFSGKKELDPEFYLSNQIFVFDWDGNPIQKLLLDRYVSCIYVSNDDKELFGVDPGANVIVKSDLKH